MTSRRTERREVETDNGGSGGPGGLKWVTHEEWRNMPGGEEGNPLVTHWKADEDGGEGGGGGQARKCR